MGRFRFIRAMADVALAGAAFAGPASALALPRLPKLGLRALSVAQLRAAYRMRWASMAAAATAMAVLVTRRRGLERRAAIAVDGAALGSLLAFAPRLYRAELATTRVRGLAHLEPHRVDGLIHPEAQIAGAWFGGQAVAYPVALLSRARPFIDAVGGLPIVPVVERQSHAAIALVSGLKRGALDLVQLGSVENAQVLYDRARGNAFRPLAGRIEAGPDAGEPLALRPLVRASWSAWRTLHPESLLAFWDAPPAHLFLHHLGARELTVRHVPEEPMSRALDPRLAPPELVLGIHAGGVAHAFTRTHLHRSRVARLRLGGKELAVLFDPQLDIAQAFFAELDGQTLALAPYPGRHAVAQDSQGDLWDVAGRCIKGARYGRHLAPVPLSIDRVFWFAWAHFHPHTGLDGWASTAQHYWPAPRANAD